MRPSWSVRDNRQTRPGHRQDDTLDPHAVALLLPWTEADAGLLAASGMFGSRIDVGPGTPDDIRLPGLLGRTT
jgi:hypothetical protein